eukprot:6178556-Pleurochrysis_carterae.AAC.4
MAAFVLRTEAPGATSAHAVAATSERSIGHRNAAAIAVRMFRAARGLVSGHFREVSAKPSVHEILPKL